ncbi:hypothetical protein MSBRW_0601 [Methanosarcina barkeri str. Wiesmoor]|uniref:Uncharacterized protein n=2 Tax=Methanosarcina barkeri TaxID=2208 RepID=A0A0E3QK29_METBA|nr:hypothetical protein MSBRW_0601 [Methanosarcina barkeri str. Wiesmoor]
MGVSSMTTEDDIMATLNNQWYNAVVMGLNLDPAQFQLAQGAVSLGYNNEEIWEFFDAIPPESTSNFWGISKHNNLSAGYGSVINNLVTQDSGDFRKKLGNNYNDWLKYKVTNDAWKDITADEINKDPVEALKKVFRNWAVRHLDSDTTKAALTYMDQVDIVSVAVGKWVAAKGNYAYTAGVTQLKDKVEEGQKKTFVLDSNQTNTDTSKSWAKGNLIGVVSFFIGDANAKWDNFIQTIKTKGVNMQVTFKKVATLEGGPYCLQTNLNPDLNDYMPWWDSAVIQAAKADKSNNMWKHESPTWEDAFGETGFFLRAVDALIVVDGIDTVMTVKATVDTDKRKAFEDSVSAGYWPFLEGEVKGGWKHDVKYSDSGTVTITSSCPEGNPNVIGVLVSSI